MIPFIWFGERPSGMAPKAVYERRTVKENGRDVERITFIRGGRPLEDFATHLCGLSRQLRIQRAYRRVPVEFSWKHPFKRHVDRPVGAFYSVQPQFAGAIWTIISEPLSDRVQEHPDGSVQLTREDGSVVTLQPDGQASWSNGEEIITTLDSEGNERWTRSAFDLHSGEVRHHYSECFAVGKLGWRDGTVANEGFAAVYELASEARTWPTFHRIFRTAGDG